MDNLEGFQAMLLDGYHAKHYHDEESSEEDEDEDEDYVFKEMLCTNGDKKNNARIIISSLTIDERIRIAIDITYFTKGRVYNPAPRRAISSSSLRSRIPLAWNSPTIVVFK
jgi:hypothetical protein